MSSYAYQRERDPAQYQTPSSITFRILNIPDIRGKSPEEVRIFFRPEARNLGQKGSFTLMKGYDDMTLGYLVVILLNFVELDEDAGPIPDENSIIVATSWKKFGPADVHRVGNDPLSVEPFTWKNREVGVKYTG